MCDYSLHNVASRPAKVGDKLVSTEFGNSITRGFTAIGEPNVAVCLLPGTEVAFDKEIEYERGLGFFPKWSRVTKFGERVARFRQVNKEKPKAHHDALEFPDGQIVLVTLLCEGQHATVLQLPVAPRAAEVASATGGQPGVGRLTATSGGGAPPPGEQAGGDARRRRDGLCGGATEHERA